MSLRCWLITESVSSVESGKKAPQRQSSGSNEAANAHFSPIASTINSCDTMPRPNNSGKEIKAVKRIIFRSTAN